MRKFYRFSDGTLIEPRDTAGRGHTVHAAGWVVHYPNGQRVETSETLSALRARLGKATAFATELAARDPRQEKAQ